ncbi:MAG: hypothetical protein LC687_05880, partial [Actinobacteria bacterium]|nr:hypothetical protein [Actinomycetota bacterium]
AIGYEKSKRVKKGWAKEAFKLKFKGEPPPKPTKVGVPDDEIHKWNLHMIIREKYRKNPRRFKDG